MRAVSLILLSIAPLAAQPPGKYSQTEFVKGEWCIIPRGDLEQRRSEAPGALSSPTLNGSRSGRGRNLHLPESGEFGPLRRGVERAPAGRRRQWTVCGSRVVSARAPAA